MSLSINFHNAATVSINTDYTALLSRITQTYSPFVTTTPVSKPDIIVRPLDEKALPKSYELPKARERFFTVLDDEGTPLVIFPHRNTTDVIVRLGSPAEIYFTPRSGIASRVLDCLYATLHFILTKQNAGLFKGAAVMAGGKCAVLTGISGAGKTSSLLHLLSEGFGYLSDNTFILQNKKAHRFRTYMVFNTHHLLHMPWALGNTAQRAIRVSFPRLRTLLKNILHKTMPLPVTQSHKVRRIVDPYIIAEPQTIFPSCTIFEIASPSLWVILTKGPRYSFRFIERDEALQRISAIQEHAHPERHALRTQLGLLGMYKEYCSPSFLNLNIYGSFTLATLPHGATTQESYALLSKDIRTALTKGTGAAT